MTRAARREAPPKDAPRETRPTGAPKPAASPEREDDRPSGPIVPAATVAGHSLTLVIAIMTYLACLTVGAVSLVAETTASWESAIASEVTIQIRPAEGIDAEAQAQAAAEAAGSLPGIASVRVLSEEENARLLEPWLGAGLDLGDLPVPRLIVLQMAPGQTADMAELRARLAGIRGASLDDQRVWQDRLRSMSRTLVVLGLAVLSLVLIATILTVVFATRGAMASNRDIVSVLNFVGARQSFIAREFQRHFLVLGLKGGAYGGGMALVTFVLAQVFVSRFGQSAEVAQIDILFGSFGIGPVGYAGAAAVVAIIALLTAATSRYVVLGVLRSGEERG